MGRTCSRNWGARIPGPVEQETLDVLRINAARTARRELTCSNDSTISAATFGKRKCVHRRPTESADQMARARERGIGGGRALPVLIYRCARGALSGGREGRGGGWGRNGGDDDTQSCMCK